MCNVVKSLGRLAIRQEDSISILQQDTQLILFLKNRDQNLTAGKDLSPRATRAILKQALQPVSYPTPAPTWSTLEAEEGSRPLASNPEFEPGKGNGDPGKSKLPICPCNSQASKDTSSVLNIKLANPNDH